MKGDEQSIRRSGHAFTILRREESSKWVVIRDANMLIIEPSPSA